MIVVKHHISDTKSQFQTYPYLLSQSPLCASPLPLEHHHRSRISRLRIPTTRGSSLRTILQRRASMRKEEHLDGQGQAKVQRHHNEQQHLARLAIGSAEHRIQVPEQESNRHTEPNAHKHPVKDSNRRPANQRHRDPDEVGITVQSPALEQVGGFRAKVPQGEVQSDWQDEGVAVDETSGTCCFLIVSNPSTSLKKMNHRE